MALGTGNLGGVATDAAGSIFVGGATSGALQIGSKAIAAPDAGGSFGPFLLKLDPSGALVWSRSFAGQGNIDAIAVDGADNVYIAGDFNGGGQEPPTLDLGNGVLDGTLFIAKLDPTGATLWSQAFQPFRNGNGSISPLLSLAVDPAGDVAVMGAGLRPGAFGPNAASDAAVAVGSDIGFLAAFDPAGHYQYSKVFDGDSLGPSAQFDPSGNLFIAGSFQGTFDLDTPLAAPGGAPPPSGADPTAFAAKLTPTGQVQWQLADGTYSAASAAAAYAGGSFVAGTFSGSMGLASPTNAVGGSDVFVTSLDETGKPTFETTFKGFSESITALAADPTGGVVVIGRLANVIDLGGGLLSPPGIVLAKLDATGRHVFSARFGTAMDTGLSTDPWTTGSVAVDPAGNVIAAGGFYGAIDLGTGVLGADSSEVFPPTMFVAKYSQEPSPAAPTRSLCPLASSGELPDAGRLVAPAALAGVSDVALGPDSVYWSTGAEVMSAPLVGGDPVVLAYAQKNTVALAIDSRSLYWADRGSADTGYASGPGADGTIASIGLDGGSSGVIAGSQDAPRAIAVDDVNIYWTAGGSLGADGGQSPGQVLSVPLGGGAPTVLVTGLGVPGPIAVSGGLVVFASAVQSPPAGTGLGSTLSTIEGVPRAGGAATPLATTDRTVESIAVDGTAVYWVDGDSPSVDTSTDDGRIRSVALTGGAPSVLSSSQAGPGKMVLVGGTLFWSTRGSLGNRPAPGDAALWSLPVAGGAPTSLVGNRVSLGPLAVDATHLAWADTFDVGTGVAAIFVKSR